MSIHRRSVITLLAGLPLLTACQASDISDPLMEPTGANDMYGRIAKMTAKPGQRDLLISILIDGLQNMAGSLSYIIAADSEDADVIWITEAWSDQKAHTTSLSLPPVQAAIAKARPLIAGMETLAQTRPLGGTGL